MQSVIEKVRDTLVTAASTFRRDQMSAYRSAIVQEKNINSKWVLETILENAQVAAQRRCPLCDDTGIPHLFLELGPNKSISGDLLAAIKEGVKEGLRLLPGRPMAIKGDDSQRIDQSGGLDDASEAVEAAPIIIKAVEEDVIRLHVLMLGGGPAIRGKTQRIFHKHSTEVVINEIVAWSKEAVSQLGCTPCTLAIGVGRSQFEATAMMIEAMVYGNYDIQNEMEREITNQVNCSGVGALGLGGEKSVLATFMKVGPQRASGVRVVSFRPCCCMEPRRASVEL